MYDILTLQEFINRLYAATSPNSRIIIEPFGYSLSFTSLAGVSGTATGTFNVNANADFFCTRIAYHANTGTVQNVGTKTVAFLRANIVDNGSARAFFNSPVALENFASNEYPNKMLAWPRYMQANTSISVQLSGWAPAAETYSVDLFFEGVSVREFS